MLVGCAAAPSDPDGSCDQCGGTGEIVPLPYSGAVFTPVCAELIRLVVTLRAESRWDSMNEALDWGTKFLDASLESVLSDPALRDGIQSHLEKVVEAGAEVRHEMQDRPTIRPASGLSTQELEELGVLEP